MPNYRFRWNQPGVINLDDNSVATPGDTRAWREYMEWMYAGNEASPAVETLQYKPELTKVTIINRLTDQELLALNNAREYLPLRQQMLWDNAQSIDTDNQDLRNLFNAVLGESRTEEVLSIVVSQ